MCTYKIVNKFQMHLNVFMTLKEVCAYAYEFIKPDTVHFKIRINTVFANFCFTKF